MPPECSAKKGQGTLPSHRRRWFEVLLLFVLAVAILSPRLFALDRFVTVDEPRWLVRSANMYLAISRGDWVQTYLREHPGVITMWAGTAGLLWRFPGYSRVATDWVDEAGYEAVLAENGLEFEEDIIDIVTALFIARYAEYRKIPADL